MNSKYYLCLKFNLLRFLIAVNLFLVFLCGYVLADPLDDVLLSVSDAISLRERDSNSIFIDVRDKDSFDKAHIPSSIQIPLHFVKTKSYLKNMRLIIVNEGYDYRSILKEKQRLEGLGYSIFILSGGMSSWCQQRRKIKPENGNCSGLNLIPASIATSEYFFSENIFVYDISKDSQYKVYAEEVDLPIKSEDKVDLLKQDIEKMINDDKSRVTIFNETGDYSLFENSFQNIEPTIFFLAGGYEGYRKASEEIEAMQVPVEKRTKKIGGCPTCPPLTEEKVETD